MAAKRRSFELNKPSAITQRADELKQAMIDLLADGKKRSFNDVFMGVQDTVKRLYPAKGNELMRLQAYELLTQACSRGYVNRAGRDYFRDVPVAKVTQEEGGAP